MLDLNSIDSLRSVLPCSLPFHTYYVLQVLCTSLKLNAMRILLRQRERNTHSESETETERDRDRERVKCLSFSERETHIHSISSRFAKQIFSFSLYRSLCHRYNRFSIFDVPSSICLSVGMQIKRDSETVDGEIQFIY